MDLAATAREIKTQHAEWQTLTKLTIDCARAIGDMLLNARAQFEQRSGFRQWVQDECDVPYGTAKGHMRIAKNWGVIEKRQKELGRPLRCREASNYLAQRNGWPGLQKGTRAWREAHQHDTVSAGKIASDGDLIDMFVDMLAERDHPERILEQVAAQLSQRKKRVSLVG